MKMKKHIKTISKGDPEKREFIKYENLLATVKTCIELLQGAIRISEDKGEQS